MIELTKRGFRATAGPLPRKFGAPARPPGHVKKIGSAPRRATFSRKVGSTRARHGHFSRKVGSAPAHHGHFQRKWAPLRHTTTTFKKIAPLGNTKTISRKIGSTQHATATFKVDVRIAWILGGDHSLVSRARDHLTVNDGQMRRPDRRSRPIDPSNDYRHAASVACPRSFDGHGSGDAQVMRGMPVARTGN